MRPRFERSRRGPLRAYAAVAAVAILLTGCAGAATPGPSPSATAALGSPANADEGVVVLTGADCIVGSWLLDNYSFAALISSIDAGVVDEVSGIARFRASENGDAETQYVDWTHVIRMSDPDGLVTMVRNGVDSGTYVVEDDGRITLVEHTLDSTIVSEVVTAGVTVTVPPVENSPGALHLAVFTCVGDELTVTVDGRSSVMFREG